MDILITLYNWYISYFLYNYKDMTEKCFTKINTPEFLFDNTRYKYRKSVEFFIQYDDFNCNKIVPVFLFQYISEDVRRGAWNNDRKFSIG